MFAQEHEIEARLGWFNGRWQRRHRVFASCCGGGWWGMGTVIDEELRHRYEGFLPVEEFCRDLRLLAGDYLGDEALIPNALQGGTYLSLPDLWAVLEEPYVGHVRFAYGELLGLLCNVAEPSRMGTAVGRYPEQLRRLQAWLRGRARVRLLDLGCGVGLGTYELAACAAGVCGEVAATGVTAEGLEVWMAEHRRLPHDWRRERQFAPFSGLEVCFRKGLAECYGDGSRYDVIICNGLAGGRYLHGPEALSAFLSRCRSSLLPGGIILLSNRFHEGVRPGVGTLCQIACASGWRVSGHWQSLELQLLE